MKIGTKMEGISVQCLLSSSPTVDLQSCYRSLHCHPLKLRPTESVHSDLAHWSKRPNKTSCDFVLWVSVKSAICSYVHSALVFIDRQQTHKDSSENHLRAISEVINGGNFIWIGTGFVGQEGIFLKFLVIFLFQQFKFLCHYNSHKPIQVLWTKRKKVKFKITVFLFFHNFRKNWRHKKQIYCWIAGLRLSRISLWVLLLGLVLDGQVCNICLYWGIFWLPLCQIPP